MKLNLLKLIIFFVAGLFLFGFCFFAFSQTLNAGFASSLWYSKDPFFVGERIRIYTAFQNHSGYDLTGKISFFDEQNLIGETDFTAVNNSLVEKWVDWQASFGDHSFTVKLSDVKKSEPGKAAESVSLSLQVSLPDRKFVDYDSDQDGLSDEQELLFKTDPRELDTDKDGLSDGQEINQGTDPLVQEKNLAQKENALPEQVQEATVKTLNFVEKQRQKAIVELDRILVEQKQKTGQAAGEKAWLEPQIKLLNQNLPFMKIPEDMLTRSNLFVAGISLLITVLKVDWLFWPLLIVLALFCFKAIRFFLRRRS
ncbi:MAG: hypothetical protein Q8N16_01715 [bacterium]|nr:hypothetical protein [bacterium]